MSGVARIVVHHIGTPTAGIRLKGNSDRRYLESALRATRLETLVGSYDDRSTWRFGAPVARAYAPDCVFGVPPVADPYDVLALAPAAASCARPATVATSVAAARSEQIVAPETFRPIRRADSFSVCSRPTPTSNRSTAAAHSTPTCRRAYRTSRSSNFRRNPPPRQGFSLRMYSTAPRRVYVQLYAPDELNYLQATVDFSGRRARRGTELQRLRRRRPPRLGTFRYVRLASINTQKGDVRMYVGSARWLYGAAHTSVPQYLDRVGGPI